MGNFLRIVSRMIFASAMSPTVYVNFTCFNNYDLEILAGLGQEVRYFGSDVKPLFASEAEDAIIVDDQNRLGGIGEFAFVVQSGTNFFVILGRISLYRVD